MTDRFQYILKKNKLRYIRFHDLRHSCASLLVASKVPMKNVQEWLGHSNFNTTADVYSHLDYSSKYESANAIASALSSSEPREEKTNIEQMSDEDLDEQLEKLQREREERRKRRKQDQAEM